MNFRRRALFAAACVGVLLLASLCIGSSEHVQMHSIAPPILGEYWENGLRYWSFGSNAVVTDQYVRITGTTATSRGYFWNRHPNHLESFEVNVTLRLLRRQQGWFTDTTDGGVAIWYTAATPRHVPTNFYGSNAAFEGLGVVMDHSDHLSILVNDGDAVADMVNSRLGYCRISGLNENLIKLTIRYDNEAGTLDVFYAIMKWSQNTYPEAALVFDGDELCAHVPHVQLPTRNYFGVTATNSKTAQANHELISFVVRPLHGGSEAENEEIRTGLHVFDLAQEKQLQKEWEGREDVEIIPVHKEDHHEDHEPQHHEEHEPQHHEEHEQHHEEHHEVEDGNEQAAGHDADSQPENPQ